MNDSSDLVKSHIQPMDNVHWQATVANYRDYLAGCRAWLTAYNRIKPVSVPKPDKRRDTGLPRDAANHRSTFVYLKAA